MLNHDELGDKIQRQLDHDSIVTLPDHYLFIRKPLRVGSNTILRGQRHTVICVEPESNCPAVIVKGTNSFIENLVVDGGANSQSQQFSSEGLSNTGILVMDSTDIQIKNVRCTKCRSGGLVLTGVTNSEVRDYIGEHNTWDGLACYETKGCYFYNLILCDNTAAGLSVDNDFANNVLYGGAIYGNTAWGIFIRKSANNVFYYFSIKQPATRIIFSENCDHNEFNGLTIDDTK